MSANARLFIEGKEVGRVMIKSRADSWGFGDFVPADDFADFASLFGSWSLLMHAVDGEKRLSRDASEELRQAERLLDSLHVKMFIERDGEWLDLSQLNIDGSLIERKLKYRHATPAA